MVSHPARWVTAGALLLAVVLVPTVEELHARDRTTGSSPPRPPAVRTPPVPVPAPHARTVTLHAREHGTGLWSRRRVARAGQIEGFTTRVSGLPGEPVDLKVSTSAATFRVVAYRFGDYRGGPAHPVWSSRRLHGVRQPGPTMANLRTRTVVAPWRTSLTVRTDGWREGFYAFSLTTGGGWTSLVPYTVRSRTTSGRVALVAPVVTWQAYNDWGGYSLYVAPPGDRRAWAVSFDRPFAAGSFGELGYSIIPLAVAAERAHVPLGFLTDVDLDRNPGLLQGARAYISIGHDEYWSHRMREAVMVARDTGTNLAFLGANTMYWKVRLAGRQGSEARTVVGYKTDAALDPLRTRAPMEATGLFRDAPEGPERRLTGMDYECFPVNAPFRVASPGWWGFAGTGVRAGTRFPDLVGVEADRAYPADDTPRPLQILAYSTYSCHGVRTSTQATYYTTRSHAGVLDVGTLRWTCALAGRCGKYHPDRATIRFTRQVTHNVLRTFAEGPAGRTHPARDNLDSFHLPAVNRVPAS